MAATDGDGAGLLEFLLWAGDRGELNPTTARALASTARKVLSIEEDGARLVLRNIDVEELLQRFENLNRTEYSSASMSTYISRFKTAVAMYLAWLDKRSDWKTLGPATKRISVKKETGRAGKESQPKKPEIVPSHGAAPTVSNNAGFPAERMIPYEVPLRPNLRARLVLPEDLSARDARRISAFVQSLAFDENDSAEDSEQLK